MKRPLSRALFAAALLCSAAFLGTALFGAGARAQSFEISFNFFHDQLSRHGDWVYSDRWGEVWIPADVPGDFRPYDTDGYWGYTEDYGWTWVSDYDWGDIAFHYGRWVDDPDDGWLWVPGYVWSPAWVAWRSNDRMIGWMPMPPDRDFLEARVSFGGGPLRFDIDFNNPNDFYGYARWYGPAYNYDRFASDWVFVGIDHVADRNFHRYAQPRTGNTTIIRNTTNVTNYTVVNNVVVNRSVNVDAVRRATGRPVQAMPAAQVMHRPQFIARIDQSRRAQEAQQAAQPAPRGTGQAGSAPAPTAQVVNGLSNKVPQRNGRGSAHLYTRDTVANAPVGGRTPAEAQRQPARGDDTDRARAEDQQRRDQQQRAQSEAQQRAARGEEERQRQDQQQRARTQDDRQRQDQQQRARAADDQQRAANARAEQDRVEQERQREQQQQRARAADDQQRAANARAEQARVEQERQREQQQRATDERAQQERAARTAEEQQRRDDPRRGRPAAATEPPRVTAEPERPGARPEQRPEQRPEPRAEQRQAPGRGKERDKDDKDKKGDGPPP